jgi:uncharacterized protein with FMN-binding domain
VTLGSAAVFAVYSAGYLRTRSAAERFATEAAERRPVVRTPAVETPSRPVLDGATSPVSRAQSSTSAAGSADSGAPIALSRATGPATVVTSPQPSRKAPRESSLAPSVAPKAATQSARTTDSTQPSSAAGSGAASAAPTSDSTTGVAAQGVDSTSQASDKDHATLKDGTYSGWGTSRHGDIEASVEIKDGRIVSATITQCLTRYSCSWIAALPGQVVWRQSAEVDFVSGATQSTNAFYYAVLEALSKAK